MYVEIHADICKYSFELGSKYSPYGVHMSVRAPPGYNPLVMVGQDEARFMQFLLIMKQYLYTEVKQDLLPRTDGLYLMILPFQSR